MCVCVFFSISGTTTNQAAVLGFKRGAFVAGRPVQPVACRIESASGLDTAWVNDGPSQLVLFARLMAEPWNQVCMAKVKWKGCLVGSVWYVVKKTQCVCVSGFR